MDEIRDEFYVALPSNSSTNVFPGNTPSSYRTKLASALMLEGDFECGVKEIFIPRNYFNVVAHNSVYSLTYEKVVETSVEFMEYKIDFPNSNADNTIQFWEELNQNILKIINKGVTFVFDPASSSLKLTIENGFEVVIKKESKFLFMLHLPNEDITITKSSTYRFRSSNQLKNQTFTIINRNPRLIHSNKIPIAPLNAGDEPKSVNELADVLTENVKLLNLEKFIQVSSEENELRLKMAPHVRISFKTTESPYLMKAFNIEEGEYYGDENFVLNAGMPIPVVGFINIKVKEYYTKLEKKRVTENYLLDVGIYDTSQKLFKSIKGVHMSLLPNSKVKMIVPPGTEIKFIKGLADMLGFVNTDYGSGTFVSEYALELDAGVTELYIYSDIISAYHVGDTFAKCLCVIPCMSEQGEQIVRHYQNPLYFPVSQNFIESILIEIKTSSGNNIIFNGGKAYVLLSFRRRRL